MKQNISCRIAALVLALLMIVPMISIPSFAETTAMNSEIWDFENFETGHKITAADGATNVGGTTLMAFNKVLEDETGNRFWRVPLVATDVSSANALKTQPTNRAGSITIPHAAFSTTEATSIVADLDLNYVQGTNPYAGIWIYKLSYTDADGKAASRNYNHLAEVNMATGELTFKEVKNYTRTGAKGLVAGQWNRLEIVFYPQNGNFDIFINGAAYAYNCTVNGIVGTNFTVAANQVIIAVCSGNATDVYKTPATAGNDFENANSLDIDNVAVKTTTGRDIAIGGNDYESYAIGATNALTSGSYLLPVSKVVSDGEDGKAVRIPFVIDGSTTNKGRLGYVAHSAISAGSVISIKTDILSHAITTAGAKSNPYAGMWFLKMNYLPDGATEYKNADFPRLFEFDLVTGAIHTGKTNAGATRGTLTGAPGLTYGKWNTVEVLLDTATGTFEIYVNGVLYLKDGYFYNMKGTNYSFQANHLAYTVCSGNDVTNFRTLEEAGENYVNTTYVDYDNTTVSLKKDTSVQVAEADGSYGFEDQVIGTTPGSSTGISSNGANYSLIAEDSEGDKALRLPFIKSVDNHLTKPTNSGGIIYFKHAQTPTTGVTSIKADLYLNYVQGTNPNVGLWANNLYYTNASGAAASASWFHFADIDMKTGEVIFTGHTVNNTKIPGAVGMKSGEWNTIEILFDHDTGFITIYINGALYSNSSHGLVGSDFYFKANTIIFCISSANTKDAYTLEADVNATYSNCNYADIDNVSISAAEEADRDTDLKLFEYGFEDMNVGDTTNFSNNLTTPATVVDENGDKVIKIPYEGKKRDDADQINIDKNAYIAHPEISYLDTERLILEERIFIPAEHTGVFDIRFGGATCTLTENPGEENETVTANKGISWPTLWRLDYKTAGTTATIGVVSNKPTTVINDKLPKGKWVTLTADIDMVNGIYDTYVDGVLAIDDIKLIGQYHSGNWHYGEVSNLTLSANRFVIACPLQGNNASKGNYVLIDDIVFYNASAELTGAAVGIGEDFSVNYYADLGTTNAPAYGDLRMDFTVGDQSVSVYDYEIVNGEYVFTLSGIAPQQLCDKIDAKLYAGNVLLATKEDYSIKDNLVSLLSKGAKGLGLTVEKFTALKELISDALNYGAAAQTYRNYNADALANAGVAGLDASARIPAASDNVLKLNGNTDKGLYFKSATVRFDTVNTIRVKIVADAAKAEDATVFVNGEAVALTELALINGEYYLDIEGITALDLDKTFEIILTDNDTVTAMTYSVNTYVSAMLASESASASMKDLALALYRYGMSAVAYAQI